MTHVPGEKERSTMIRHFPGLDFGLVIMGLHWAYGVKGGYIEGAEQRSLTELGLDILDAQAVE